MHRGNQSLRGLLGRTWPAREAFGHNPPRCDPGRARSDPSARTRDDGEDDRGLAGDSGIEALRHQRPAIVSSSRCATFVVRIEGHTPLELATKLGERGFFTWDGNYYALNLTEQLDVERLGGFLRIGLVHYNTMEEVERLLGALREIVA